MSRVGAKMQGSARVLRVLLLVLLSLQQVQLQHIQPVLLVHGGAGDVTDESIPAKKLGVKLAARIGYEVLRSTGNVLDAVQEAVLSMELDENFNSGYGSVLNWEGDVEMDAAIMDGAALDAGCVAAVRDIYHPIVLARRVMERTRHKFLCAEGAMAFAVEEGFELLPEGALVTAKELQALDDYKNSLDGNAANTCPENAFWPERQFGAPGTVGAVAIDAFGNVAAATSTGGITGKMPGRVGDSPILGGGTYADNAAGTVSATGHGETIMRYNVASRILALIAGQGKSAGEAAAQVLEQMTARLNQTAGVISIDANGSLGIYFTTRRMSWAYQRGDELHYGIEQGEDVLEIIADPRIDL